MIADSYFQLVYNYRLPPVVERAARAWRRIMDKPTVLTIFRAGEADIEGVVVRLEVSGGAEVANAVAEWQQYAVILFGVVGHPEVPDTDIRADDRFIHQDRLYEIHHTLYFAGELQGYGIVVE